MPAWTIHFVGLKNDCIDYLKGLDIPPSLKDGLTLYVSGIPDQPNPADPNWSGGPDIKMIGNGYNYGILAFEALPFDPNASEVPPAQVSPPEPISEVPATPS